MSQPEPPAPRRQPIAIGQVREWFRADVMPLEAELTRYLRRHCKDVDEIADLRQEVYIRAFEAVKRDGPPESARAFVFILARNLLVDRVRRAQVVAFETVADLGEFEHELAVDFTPEQLVGARKEMQLLQHALDELSPRCREVLLLRKVEGLSHKEISSRLGIAEGTIEKQITVAVRSLAETLGGQGVAAAVKWMWRMRRGEREQ